MLWKLLDNLRIAFTAIKNNRTRSFLTMLGITIGVSSVILLLSVGQAVERFVINEFSQFGSNIVVVVGKANNEVFDQFTTSEMEMFVPLTDEDLAALRDPLNVPDAAVVAPALGVEERIFYNGEYYDEPQIAGIDPDYLEAYTFEIGIGEGLTWDHVNSAARVAIIGTEVAEEVFNNEYPIGKSLRIGDVTFEVIGVWQELKSALDPTVNNIVIVPISTVQRRLLADRTINGNYPVTSISVQARSPEVVEALVEEVRQTMRETRDLSSTDVDTFVVFSQNQLLDTLDTITSLMTVFLATIAGISLMVGGIGIMNIMLVTVTERTKEIGLRKAVGAQRGDIIIQFLTEAIALSLIGGALGTAFAMVTALLVGALVPDLNVEVQLSSVLIATVISISIGTFFGAYPAGRAASLNPIDALRYE
ncbi:MAG: ABC transporter permease [Phototrophicaceae bacterium]